MELAKGNRNGSGSRACGFPRGASVVSGCCLAFLGMIVWLGLSNAANAGEDSSLLDIDPSSFSNPTDIDNEWWPLKPGMQYVYEGYTVEDDGEKLPHRIVATVTDLTKVINGVRTVVLYDLDIKDDQLEEAELAFKAQDDEGNVWHLGEYTEVYSGDEFVGGKMWAVGHLKGARAGIQMKATPKLGEPSYSQGLAPPPYNWTDRGRVAKMGQKTTTASGKYEDVLVTEEFNNEEPGAIQLKYYARGVGNVRIGWAGEDKIKETMELVKVIKLDGKALAKARAAAMQLETRAYVYGLTPPAEQDAPPSN